jgi:DNA-binding transcriptional MocR family regulator
MFTEMLRSEVRRYSPGEKLPSNRVLVHQHHVSPVTVSRALGVLSAEGLVITRPGAGAYRADEPPASGPGPGDTSWQEITLSAEPAGEALPRSVDAEGVLATLAVPPSGTIELTGAYLHSSLQPERALAAALARAGRRPGAWGRPPTDGLPELRAWFAREIGGSGGAVSPSDVLITDGGQRALTTALRALAPPGAPLLVESPTYPGLLAIARASGLRPVPVPVDREGVRTDLLEAAFRASGARVFVCQPLFQNPTGTVLSPRRRADVLSIARAAGAFVIEDDFARHLAHDGTIAPAPLAAADPDGVVVHVCSLTKAVSPSLRVAALAARGPALERLRAVSVIEGFFVPRPLQEAALELVGAPAWPRHLRAVAVALRARRDTLLGAIRRELPESAAQVWRVPSGGGYVWLRLAAGTDEAALAAAGLRAGVAVVPGRLYYPAEPPAPHLRLSFTSASGEGELVAGVQRLRTAFGGLGTAFGGLGTAFAALS